jgi:phosphoribosylformylglycinamidine synthase
MKFGVKVMPREVILDTQGRSVEHLLKTNQFELSSCRVGKYIEIEVPAASETEAREQIKKMADFVLYNPLIETYQVEKL